MFRNSHGEAVGLQVVGDTATAPNQGGARWIGLDEQQKRSSVRSDWQRAVRHAGSSASSASDGFRPRTPSAASPARAVRQASAP